MAIYVRYWCYCAKSDNNYKLRHLEFLKFSQEVFAKAGIKNANPQFREEATVLMILNSLNIIPDLLKNSNDVDGESISRINTEQLINGYKK